jgi:hypothetical protein
MKLDWRDGYSMHFIVKQPHDTTLEFRPLANEIVDSVWSRYPGSAVRDSLHRTFVELGLFYTKNTTGNPLKDTNHIFLVNRRCFERTEDVAKGSASGDSMDALAETRTIEVKLNMMHPIDTSEVYGQYTFIRVRELAPDTARLPLATTWRRGLDTIVHPDSAFSITLGPGRAALLRITYATPDSSIVNGSLEYSSQRKILWDGVARYYAAYHRWDSARNDFHVFFRRSLPLPSTTGIILWDPNERCISCSTETNDTVRAGNKFPSLTMRIRSAKRDSVISIAWQRYDEAHPANREIVMRDIGWGPSNEIVNAVQQYRSRIRRIDTYQGQNDEFGTVVLTSSAGGEILCWADSVYGIRARLRRSDTLAYWWSELDRPLMQLALSPTVNVYDAQQYSTADHGGARFPTVAPFSHRARRDSSTGIAWQQRLLGSSTSPSTNAILYTRLTHTVTTGQDSLSFPEDGQIQISSYEPGHMHPSIDLMQDSTTTDTQHTLREAIAWERVNDLSNGTAFYRTDVHYQSVFSSLDSGSVVTINPRVTLRADSGVTVRYTWPNISAVQNRYLQPAQSDSSRFAIVWEVRKGNYTFNTLKHGQIAYRQTGYRNGWPRTYSYDGRNPTGSGSTGDQSTRYSALYKRVDMGPGGEVNDTALRTSRQFFAKARPTGYMAEGREVRFTISDSTASGISASLHDVWAAGDSTAHGIQFVDRAVVRTDSLDQVRALFRTKDFRATDSLSIGCVVSCRFDGDSAASGASRVTLVVELVDSASSLAVRQLDSFVVTAASPLYHRRIDTVMDLLLGSYHVRMRIDTAGVRPAPASYNAHYPVAELFEHIPDPPPSKIARRIGSAHGMARISAQPNPFGGSTEVLFSIPRSEFVTMSLHDRSGGTLATLIENTWMEAGRYSIEIDGTQLRPGNYLVDLRYGTDRIIQKLVVVR